MTKSLQRSLVSVYCITNLVTTKSCLEGVEDSVPRSRSMDGYERHITLPHLTSGVLYCEFRSCFDPPLRGSKLINRRDFVLNHLG